MIKSEEVTPYGEGRPCDEALPEFSAVQEDHILRQAFKIMHRRLKAHDGAVLDNPDRVKHLLRFHYAEADNHEAEQFCCLFLDIRHRLLSMKVMFNGTIDGATVPPREIVKAALKHNAAAVILAHNHPSGTAEPSQADKAITERLRDALALVDIRVLDHVIIGSDEESVSFAERGLI